MDLHARLLQEANLRDSNPGVIHSSSGGVVRNILDNLVSLGERCLLLSAVGDDALGRQLLAECDARGLDTRGVYRSPDYPTGVYLDILDRQGDLFMASCDARVVENIPESWFLENAQLLGNAAAVAADTNLTPAQFALVKKLAKDAKIFVDPISTAKALRIKDQLDGLYFLKPNAMELEVLSGISCGSDADIEKAAAAVLEKGVYSLAVSLGGRGCYYADREGRRFFRSLGKPAVMVNATGAGDCFMAGFLKGFMLGLSPEECTDYALACGSLAVQSSDTINRSLSQAAVHQYITENR